MRRGTGIATGHHCLSSLSPPSSPSSPPPPALGIIFGHSICSLDAFGSLFPIQMDTPYGPATIYRLIRHSSSSHTPTHPRKKTNNKEKKNMEEHKEETQGMEENIVNDKVEEKRKVSLSTRNVRPKEADPLDEGGRQERTGEGGTPDRARTRIRLPPPSPSAPALDPEIFVLFRHHRDTRLLASAINFKANMMALSAVGVTSVLLTSSIGVIAPDVPLYTPVLIRDLLFLDNRLPTGEVCTVSARNTFLVHSSPPPPPPLPLFLAPLVALPPLFTNSPSRSLSLSPLHSSLSLFLSL